MQMSDTRASSSYKSSDLRFNRERAAATPHGFSERSRCPYNQGEISFKLKTRAACFLESETTGRSQVLEREVVGFPRQTVRTVVPLPAAPSPAGPG